MENIKLTFTLNGQMVSADITPEMTLLTVLKEVLFVNSVKRACVEGECGACTVIVDGKAMNSCLILAATMEGKTVETLESLGTPENLHPLQKAFMEMGASQCGFCTPGFIMAAKAMLDENPNPSVDEIRRGLSGNLCRCTGYIKPMRAVQKAAKEMLELQPSADTINAVKNVAEYMSNAEGVK